MTWSTTYLASKRKKKVEHANIISMKKVFLLFTDILFTQNSSPTPYLALTLVSSPPSLPLPLSLRLIMSLFCIYQFIYIILLFYFSLSLSIFLFHFLILFISLYHWFGYFYCLCLSILSNFALKETEYVCNSKRVEVINTQYIFSFILFLSLSLSLSLSFSLSLFLSLSLSLLLSLTHSCSVIEGERKRESWLVCSFSFLIQHLFIQTLFHLTQKFGSA